MISSSSPTFANQAAERCDKCCARGSVLYVIKPYINWTWTAQTQNWNQLQNQLYRYDNTTTRFSSWSWTFSLQREPHHITHPCRFVHPSSDWLEERPATTTLALFSFYIGFRPLSCSALRQLILLSQGCHSLWFIPYHSRCCPWLYSFQLASPKTQHNTTDTLFVDMLSHLETLNCSCLGILRNIYPTLKVQGWNCGQQDMPETTPTAKRNSVARSVLLGPAWKVLLKPNPMWTCMQNSTKSTHLKWTVPYHSVQAVVCVSDSA